MPVETYDERLTTRMADRSAREGARADRDSLAAAHLLESYLAREGAMTEDRGDWVVDTEGNLTPPGGDGLKPPTDEFGRDDPASLERERRRREREQRRGKSKKPRKAEAPPPPRRRRPRRRPGEAREDAARLEPERRRGPPGGRARRGASATPQAARGPRNRQAAPRPRRGRPAAAEAAWYVPPPPLPGARPGPGRRARRLVPDRLLPAAAVRPGQRIRRGDRHRARGRHGERGRRPAHQERRGLERDALRVAPEAGGRRRATSCRAATSSRTT